MKSGNQIHNQPGEGSPLTSAPTEHHLEAKIQHPRELKDHHRQIHQS